MAHLVSLIPNDRSEGHSYRRNTYFHKVAGVVMLTVHTNTSSGGPAVVSARLRWRLDHVPITDWVAPETGLVMSVWRSAYDFTGTPDGSHFLDWELEGGGHTVEGIAVTVDNDGAPVSGPQSIWTGAFNFELRNGICRPGGGPIPYTPGVDPRPDPIISHSSAPYRERLLPSQLWVERMVTASRKESPRRFHDTPWGHVGIVPRQVYHWYDAPYSNVPGFFDGPRNVGTLGYVWVLSADRRDHSMWGCSVGGRMVRITTDGTITTMAGLRLKPGWLMPYHQDEDSSWWPEHGAWHKDHFEIVGEFLDGPVGFKKPWDLIQCPLHADDWYVSDTLNHRVCRMANDGATVATYAGSRRAEAGYVDGPREAARFNQPWGEGMVTVDPTAPQGHTCDHYVNDKWNHALRVVRAAGPVETVIRSRSDMRPTPKTLQVGNNDDDIPRLPLDVIRTDYLKDGPFEDCSYVTPEALRWANAERTALISAERATYTIRRIDLVARTITTLARLRQDENSRNVGLAVDVDGVVGPVGDIFVLTWGSKTYRFSASGQWVGDILPIIAGNLLNGPAQSIIYPGYPAAIGVAGDGALWVNGVGAEWCGRFTRRLPTDPVVNLTLYGAGEQFWRWGSSPSLHVLRGEGAQDQTGGPLARDLVALDNAGLRATLAVPMTDADLAGVREYLRVHAFGTVPAGLPPGDSTAPNPPGSLTVREAVWI